MSIELARITKTLLDSKPGRRLREYSIRYNPDMIRARNNLYDFAAQLFEFDDFREDFTQTRKYTAPGTGVDLLEDMSLRGKIIVEKLQRPHTKPVNYLHYISQDRSGKLGEPIIYSLNAQRVISEFADYHLPVTYDSQQNELWSAMLNRGLKNPLSVPHQLIVLNKSLYRQADPVAYIRSMFQAQNTPDFHMGVEVWQRGRGQKQGVKPTNARIALRELAPTPR